MILRVSIRRVSRSYASEFHELVLPYLIFLKQHHFKRELKRTKPMQNPVWFPLEHYTHGVEVNFILAQVMTF